MNEADDKLQSLVQSYSSSDNASIVAEIYAKNPKKTEETLPEIARLAKQIKQGCIEGYRRRLCDSYDHWAPLL